MMRELLHIEPYSDVHEAGCRDVLKRIFGDDDQSQGYYRLTPRRTVVALLQDQLIGFASVWANFNHPDTLRSGVVVIPLYRRQGVGGQLWEALLQTWSNGRSLVTSLWETQVTGHAFAVHCGFSQLSLECDSTDPWSHEVLDRFPFGPAPTWITLRRN